MWGVYRCVFSCWLEWNYRRPCPTLAAVNIAVLAASGASNQGVWGVYGRVFSWWFEWNCLQQCLRRQEITLFWFWRPQGPQEPLIRVCEVSMDASFHGGSNDTIGGRVRPRRPEILLFSHGGILILATRFRSFAERTNLCRHNSLSPVFPGVFDTSQK
jgi:hypothetical protein